MEISHNPVLGELKLSGDSDLWECTVNINNQDIQFEIGGIREPNHELISHACDIVRNFTDFSSMVAALLESEAVKLPVAAEEIRQLKLVSVHLFWIDRPNDGMIYFDGPDEYRVWRCDYINRKPCGLGFDS